MTNKDKNQDRKRGHEHASEAPLQKGQYMVPRTLNGRKRVLAAFQEKKKLLDGALSGRGQHPPITNGEGARLRACLGIRINRERCTNDPYSITTIIR